MFGFELLCCRVVSFLLLRVLTFCSLRWLLLRGRFLIAWLVALGSRGGSAWSTQEVYDEADDGHDKDDGHDYEYAG